MRLCQKRYLHYVREFCKFSSICQYSSTKDYMLSCGDMKEFILRDKNKNKLSLFIANLIYDDMLYNSCSVNFSGLKDSFVIDKINNLIRSKIGFSSTISLSSKSYTDQTDEFIEDILFAEAQLPVGKRLEVLENRIIVLIKSLAKEKISFYDELLDTAIKDLLNGI